MREHKAISTIMTKNIIALTREDDLERAEMLFNRHKIKHIPVVSGEAIIGMLSFTDLMRISFAETPDEENNSVESKMVHQIDKLEMVLQAKLYEKQGYPKEKLCSFFESAKLDITHPKLKELFRKILDDKL